MNNRDKRVLKCLVSQAKVLVDDLRHRVGSLNPAQNVLSLRKKGWGIQTGYIQVLDRDGKKCRPGFYWMEASEKERACLFFEEADRAAATAHSANDKFELENSNSSNLNDSKGDE